MHLKAHCVSVLSNLHVYIKYLKWMKTKWEQNQKMEKISCQALMFALKTSICITDLLKKKPISSIKYTFPKKALRGKKKSPSVHSLHKRKALLLVLAH